MRGPDARLLRPEFKRKMINAINRIAEQRIKEALERGEFEDLPGRGRPLLLEDDRGVPEDLRMAFKLLKNAGYTPEELTLKKEIARTEDLLASLTDEQEKLKAVRRINLLVLKLNEKRRSPVNLEEQERYYGRVVERVGRPGSSG